MVMAQCLFARGSQLVEYLCVMPIIIFLQKKQAAEPYSNFVKSHNSFSGPEKVSLCVIGHMLGSNPDFVT
jgi:hypothetical protein